MVPTTLNKREHLVVVDERGDVLDGALRLVGVVLGDELDLVLLARRPRRRPGRCSGSRSRPARPCRISGERGVEARLRQARAELDRVAVDAGRRPNPDSPTRRRSRPCARRRCRSSTSFSYVAAAAAARDRQRARRRPRTRATRASGRRGDGRHGGSSHGSGPLGSVEDGGRSRSGRRRRHGARSGAAQRGRTPPTMPSGSTNSSRISVMPKIAGESSAWSGKASWASLSRKTNVHAPSTGPDDRGGAADDHGDEEVDRELERLDPPGVGEPGDHDADRPGDARVERTDREGAHLDPRDVDPDRRRRGIVVPHRKQRRPKRPRTRFQASDEHDDRDREGQVVAPLIVLGRRTPSPTTAWSAAAAGRGWCRRSRARTCVTRSGNSAASPRVISAR